MAKEEERSVTARLPLTLVNRLEDARFYVSKSTGHKVTTKQLVQQAIEHFLDIVEKKLAEKKQP